MQPEISHRCSSCGASIREPAMFCPECGQSLAPAAEVSVQEAAVTAPEPTVAEPLTTSESSDGEPPPESLQTSSPAGSSQSDATNEASQPEPVAAAVTEGAAREMPSNSSTESPGKVERTRVKLQRASSAARGAIEENVKRVDKIRHASTVVFEEASYDPSLRFVLVALGLFVVFVILLVLSKVMG